MAETESIFQQLELAKGPYAPPTPEEVEAIFEQHPAVKDSRIVRYYLGLSPEEGAEDEIETFDSHLKLSQRELEAKHDFIQWFFPLDEPSFFNRNAPVLNEEDIEAFRSTPVLQAQVRRAFVKMLRFYGFNWKETRSLNQHLRSDCKIVPVGVFTHQFGWVTLRNHNFLRISRILRSLRTFGLEPEAAMFYDALIKYVYTPHQKVIGSETLKYWKEAAGRS
ncbi:hypothetical protein HDU96_002017 [Phlyctochytrium bullatum]|nr:hypothetical protein HDU96_002017 [Phlyctochytrium bullatum]